MTDLFGSNPAPTIGLGTRIETADEFNRRALKALEGVRYGENVQAPSIVASCRLSHNNRRPITERQQDALYKIVRRYRLQITDALVVDFAEAHCKGAD